MRLPSIAFEATASAIPPLRQLLLTISILYSKIIAVNIIIQVPSDFALKAKFRNYKDKRFWGRSEAGSHNNGIVGLGVQLPSAPINFSDKGRSERSAYQI